MHSLHFPASRHQLIVHTGHLPAPPHPFPPPSTPPTRPPDLPKSHFLNRLLQRYHPHLHRIELLLPHLSSPPACPPPTLFPSSPPSSPPLLPRRGLPVRPALLHLPAPPPPLVHRLLPLHLPPSLASSLLLTNSTLTLHLLPDTAQQLGLPTHPPTPPSPHHTSHTPIHPPRWHKGDKAYDSVHARLAPLPSLHLLVRCDGEVAWPEGVRLIRAIDCVQEQWQADGVGLVDLPALMKEGGEVVEELFDWVGVVAARLTDLLPHTPIPPHPLLPHRPPPLSLPPPPPLTRLPLLTPRHRVAGRQSRC